MLTEEIILEYLQSCFYCSRGVSWSKINSNDTKYDVAKLHGNVGVECNSLETNRPLF